ncbi:hypothetical protein RRG08_029634 [Elysia crispata]|uniref:Uncharacterized protein n=1 Tax=Elysia crispata TaxID=231223 RepID=A0AAE1CK99_9GAST|nr:hypothetical protein RRG08_029634 [Elysia crispata]
MVHEYSCQNEIPYGCLRVLLSLRRKTVGTTYGGHRESISRTKSGTTKHYREVVNLFICCHMFHLIQRNWASKNRDSTVLWFVPGQNKMGQLKSALSKFSPLHCPSCDLNVLQHDLRYNAAAPLKVKQSNASSMGATGLDIRRRFGNPQDKAHPERSLVYKSCRERGNSPLKKPPDLPESALLNGNAYGDAGRFTLRGGDALRPTSRSAKILGSQSREGWMGRVEDTTHLAMLSLVDESFHNKPQDLDEGVEMDEDILKILL